VDFLAHLETQRGNGPSTRNTRLAAIKAFMRFVEYRVPSSLEQSRRVLAIPKKKTDQPLVHSLSMAEMQALLDAPDGIFSIRWGVARMCSKRHQG